MKTRLIITLIGILFHLNINAQNYIYKGSEQFEATNTWSFILNGHYWSTDPTIVVARHSNGGYLMLSIEVPFESHFIKGNLTIILEDGNMINCVDRNFRDYVDNTSTNLYNLTLDEIEKMKNSRISKVRFNICVQNYRMKDEIKPFTATNNNDKFNSDFDEIDYYETDVEISNLFEE